MICLVFHNLIELYLKWLHCISRGRQRYTLNGYITPCLSLNLFSHPVPPLKELESMSGYSNGNSCCALAIRSGPLTGTPIIVQYALQFKTQLIKFHLQHFCKLAMLLQTFAQLLDKPEIHSFVQFTKLRTSHIFLFLMQSPSSISVEFSLILDDVINCRLTNVKLWGYTRHRLSFSNSFTKCKLVFNG